jgi:RHS repeat-associated protein
MYESAAVNRAYDYDRYGNRYVGTSSSQIPSPIAPGPTMPGHFNTANNRLVMSGTGFDAAGNQTTLAPYTLEYDAEGRNTVVKLSGASSATFSYDGEGRRVRKAMNGGTTYYLYDALGQMAVEYSTEPPSSTGSSYLFADMLGSVRTITNDIGAVVECYDYLPFGRMLGSGVGGRGSCYPDPPDANYDSRAPQKFTGKERDAETGLDYFGARYYSGAQGRFTGVDPSMLSAVLATPQSWNRYSYALNNPLKYIDPNGELWIASGNAQDPYSWVDECKEGQTCHETVAAKVGNSLRIYGKLFGDTFDLAGNGKGLVNVLYISQLAGAGNFVSEQTPGHEEEYLGITQAAALYNVSMAYGHAYPNDDPLVFTAGSTESGESARYRNGQLAHKSSHRGGRNIDLRYMGDDGTSLTGPSAAGQGSVERNTFIMGQFSAQRANLGGALTGDPARYGLGPIPSGLQKQHSDHMHFQLNYPKREEPRIRPGQR